MKTQSASQSKPYKSYELYRNLYKLTVAGGAAFWVTTLATSLLPVAAKYRAAFSNWGIQIVWVNSLLAGIIIGCCVSYFLLRFFTKIPTKDPILKSVILSCIALVLAIILIDVPMMLHAPSDAFYYFFIGIVFNAVRFLFLGITVGYQYKRLFG